MAELKAFAVMCVMDGHVNHLGCHGLDATW